MTIKHRPSRFGVGSLAQCGNYESIFVVYLAFFSEWQPGISVFHLCLCSLLRTQTTTTNLTANKKLEVNKNCMLS